MNRTRKASPLEFSYVYDYADILSAETERYITRMNNGLVSLTGGQIAVVTVSSYDGDLYDYALQLGNELGVGDSQRNNGIVLLLDTENGDDSISGAVAVQGDGIYHALTDQDLTQTLVTYLQEPFYSHNYDRGVIDTFDALLRWYETYYSVEILPQDTVTYQMVEPRVNVVSMAVLTLGLVLLVLFSWWILDYVRYSSYRRRYWQPGMGVPPVIYRPIFWGRHMGYRPPPPRPQTPHSNHRNDHRGRIRRRQFQRKQPPGRQFRRPQRVWRRKLWRRRSPGRRLRRPRRIRGRKFRRRPPGRWLWRRLPRRRLWRPPVNMANKNRNRSCQDRFLFFDFSGDQPKADSAGDQCKERSTENIPGVMNPTQHTNQRQQSRCHKKRHRQCR